MIHVDVNKDLERAFRAEVARRLGDGEGALTRAVEEAIRLWLGPETTRDEAALEMVERMLGIREEEKDGAFLFPPELYPSVRKTKG